MNSTQIIKEVIFNQNETRKLGLEFKPGWTIGLESQDNDSQAYKIVRAREFPRRQLSLRVFQVSLNYGELNRRVEAEISKFWDPRCNQENKVVQIFY